MTGSSVKKWDTIRAVEMVPGIIRRTLCHTDRLMMTEVRARAGAYLPTHSHPHDQAGYIVQGLVDFTFDGATHTLQPGDSYVIPGGVEHSAFFPEEAILSECFSPAREEYIL